MPAERTAGRTGSPSLPAVSLAFTDFPGTFNTDRLTSLLSRSFRVVIDEKDPDYVIYSVFGHNHLKYPDAVRIFFTGENVHPDFNLCDYAFGYDWMDFGDRYYRCPNYALYDEFGDLCRRRRSKASSVATGLRRDKFCNFIYSNGDAHPARDTFFQLLSRYQWIESAGRHFNNVGNVIGAPYDGDWTRAKLDWMRHFRFSIVFENSTTPGYTTEKLVQALAADTIPIYWGNPVIAREFNPRRFINCHEFPNLDAVVAEVRRINENPEVLDSMLEQPFFPNDVVPSELQPGRLRERFASIFGQSKSAALRRNRYCWGRKYEKRRLRETAALAALDHRGVRGRVLRALVTVCRVAPPATNDHHHRD